MDGLLRGLGIFLEWLVLSAIAYVMLSGVKLVLADLGLSPKYMKGLTMVLIVVGSLMVVFFIAHLTSFYPG